MTPAYQFIIGFSSAQSPLQNGCGWSGPVPEIMRTPSNDMNTGHHQSLILILSVSCYPPFMALNSL